MSDTRLIQLAKVMGVALVVAAVVAPDSGAKPKRTISPAAAFALPPAKQCVTTAGLTLGVRKVARVKWTGRR